MHLSVQEARVLCEGVLARHGYDEEDARLITDVLVEAHLWGRPSSGLNHLAHVVEGGARGKVRILGEDARAVLIDGGNNPGFLVSTRAMAMAIDKAKAGGFAVAAARNAFLGGINGYYVAMAARSDLIGVMATSSGRRVAPAGGIDPLFGTNPIAIAVPTLDDPIVLDMATASINVGGLQRAARLGEELGPGLAIGPDGEPTTDPARALAGAILPFGGHKGSGLSLVVQCLGLLGGGAVIPKGLGDFGYFFLAFDPGLLMPIEEFKRRTSELVAHVHAVRPAAGEGRVRVPGERAHAQRARRLETGIEIDDPLYEELCRL
jgi:LDH2 family malate/lactate/ureidoglycolate dehydrogenase